MSPSTNVAIIGAGPYGLSIATHLRERGIEFRIFGSPLRAWRSQMPKDMFLKSEGFASNLYDPHGQLTLERFCHERGLAYARHDSPVPLDMFAAYGVAFQQRLVPELEDVLVVALKRVPQGFDLTLDNGETLTARRVIVAVGLSDFRQVPAELASLPLDVLSHSAEHHDLSGFHDRDVSVIGGGSSALDVVAALRASGAHVRLVARRPALKWNMPVKAHPWRRLYPSSGLGGGWRNAFFEHAPMVFQYLPQETRMDIVRLWLGPAGGWPARQAVEQGSVLLGQSLCGAEYRDGRVRLRLLGRDGRETIVATDHVIAATGYKVDLRRLAFLGKELAAANTFGPVMRFLLGARYTARRIARHLAQPSASAA